MPVPRNRRSGWTLRRSIGALTCVVLSAASLGAATVTATAAAAVTGSHVLNDASYLTGFNDQQWYEDNIPFVDLPDKTIQDVYYYRWRTWKEHLRYTNPTDGWILTEFLDCCGYAAPYQAVDAAAGHQISEGRWVRNQSYLDDYVKFWLTGPGAGPKPATEDVNPGTTDWAHEYSFWLASAAYQRAQVTGDFSQLTALLPQLEAQYAGWDKQFNAALGLYWSVPVWDAMELSASSYQSSDPYHGGAGYRPTINSYQYGDATAIARIAALAGDRGTARRYAAKAAALKVAMQKWLWDPVRGFYYDMPRDDNPSHSLLDTREEIGFVPWQFGAATAGDSSAWSQLLDPQGFAAAYGPTTAERRSPYFLKDAGGCCRWDGPSWPFATAQTLTGLANQLDDYPAQTAITTTDYVNALETYAKTQYRNGVPYVAEAHSPDDPSWVYDGANHSEDYNHSTFNDLVLSGLLGIRAQDGRSVRLQPLVPASWDHYAVENVPYHGHNLTVLWDKDGSHYGRGTGMRVYVDGALVRWSPTVTAMTVPVGRTVSTAPAVDLVNDAANPLQQGFPKPIASYTWRFDSPWSGIDGKLWFNEVPEDTRWTNYSSPNAQDYYGVDFGVPTSVSDLRWYGYDDGGGVRPAAAYQVQYLTADGWRDIPDQRRQSPQPVGNGLNRITFPTVSTSQVRLLFTNPPGAFVGVSELQSWSQSSKAATVAVGPRGSDGAVAVNGPMQVAVTVTNTTARDLNDVTVAVAVPAGWIVSPAVSGSVRRIKPGRSAVLHVTVSAPPGAVGTDSDLVATATYPTGAHTVTSTHARQRLSVAFDPAAFPTELVNDTFDTDSLADYAALQPFPAEVVPALTAGGGRLTAGATQPFFTLLDRGLSPLSGSSVVIVDPAQFIGTATNEDSIFVGLVRDGGSYVGAWYNNHAQSSGIDLRLNGQLQPGAASAYQPHQVIAPGDRFALQVNGTAVVSWAEHAGVWTRVASTDTAGTFSAADLAGLHPMFGLRGDPGQLAVSRFEVRTAP